MVLKIGSYGSLSEIYEYFSFVRKCNELPSVSVSRSISFYIDIDLLLVVGHSQLVEMFAFDGYVLLLYSVDYTYTYTY